MFDDMLSDMKATKKMSPAVTELLLRRTKLNISLAFISQSHFRVPKTIRLNLKHHIIMKKSTKATPTNGIESFV